MATKTPEEKAAAAEARKQKALEKKAAAEAKAEQAAADKAAADEQEKADKKPDAAKVVKSAFNPDKPHCVVAGCPGTAFMQKGKYYDSNGKQTKGPV